jgi:hypothetical protein
MTNPELEEKLREAACFGDIEGVKVSNLKRLCHQFRIA